MKIPFLPDQETREGMGITFWLGTAFIALIALVFAAYYIALPWFLNQDRYATQHSNAYVQSKVTELGDLKAQYLRLDAEVAKVSDKPELVDAYRAQQNSVLRQMWNTYDLIPSDIRSESVPQHIRSFLAEHSRP